MAVINKAAVRPMASTAGGVFSLERSLKLMSRIRLPVDESNTSWDVQSAFSHTPPSA
jgi:hypothetical protein